MRKKKGTKSGKKGDKGKNGKGYGSPNQGKGRDVCLNCGQTGHWKRDCPSLRQLPQHPNSGTAPSVPAPQLGQRPLTSPSSATSTTFTSVSKQGPSVSRVEAFQPERYRLASNDHINLTIYDISEGAADESMENDWSSRYWSNVPSICMISACSAEAQECAFLA